MARRGIDAWAPVDAHPLNHGREAWWLCLPGGPRGAAWRDLKNRAPATLTNGPTWGPIRPGGWGSVTFDGSDDRAEVLGNPAAVKPTAALTLAFWHRPAANNVVAIDAEKTNAAADAYQFYLNGTVRLTIDGTTLTTAASLTLGQWYRIVGTYDGATMAIYWNGVLQASGAKTGALTYTTKNVYIGRNATSNTLTVSGPMDDVSIWSRALAADEVWQDCSLSRRGYPGVLARQPRRPRSAAVAVGVTYPRLERGVRGLNRGLAMGAA